MSKYQTFATKKNGGQDYWGHDCHDGHVYRIWALLGLVFSRLSSEIFLHLILKQQQNKAF